MLPAGGFVSTDLDVRRSAYTELLAQVEARPGAADLDQCPPRYTISNYFRTYNLNVLILSVFFRSVLLSTQIHYFLCVLVDFHVFFDKSS